VSAVRNSTARHTDQLHFNTEESRYIPPFQRNILLASSALKIEIVFSSESWVSTYESTGHGAQKNFSPRLEPSGM
jgi:hypothetical protein